MLLRSSCWLKLLLLGIVLAALPTSVVADESTSSNGCFGSCGDKELSDRGGDTKTKQVYLYGCIHCSCFDSCKYCNSFVCSFCATIPIVVVAVIVSVAGGMMAICGCGTEPKGPRAGTIDPETGRMIGPDGKPLEKKKNPHPEYIILALVGGILLLIILCLCCFCRFCGGKDDDDAEDDQEQVFDGNLAFSGRL